MPESPVPTALVALTSPATPTRFSDHLAGADSEPSHGRMTQSADFCTKPGPAQLAGSYPPELFTGAALCNGAWVIYLVGSLYMFLALSIVCDEFFVPALEVIVERTKIAVRPPCAALGSRRTVA